MRRFRFVLTLSIGLAMAFGVTLACVAYPDLPSLWLSLLSALLAFLLTDLWHRLGAREREALYLQLLRHLPTRLRIRDTRGRMLLDNRPGDVDGMLLQENLPLDRPQSPDTLPPVSLRVWEGLREVLASGERQEMSIALPAAEGRPARVYRQIFFPMFNGQRRITALGSLLIDETDLHDTANALRALTSDLESQVRERTRELELAREAAERQAELQAEFMAHLSHEIRSPLGAVIGLSHLARRNARDPQLNGYLDKLRKAAEHLLEIVNDVLDFSRLDAGHMPIAQVPYSPAGLVWNVVDMVCESVREKGLALGVELDPRTPVSLCGDPLRLAQILINLAGNAVKFTARGRIDLRLVLLERRGETVRLRFEVEDTGVGIAAEDLPLLFKPFSQLSARTDHSSGSGLGLAISARLAGLMGGELGVRSTPGQGSLFFLELECPVCEAQAEVSRGELLGERPLKRLAGHTVLLVEDDPLIREVSAELLQALGLRVRIAADGRQALERLHNEADISLVFMDLQMPGMDGLEATRQLRRHWPDLPVIAVSGNTRERDRQLCRAVGMNDFLAKPVALEQLKAMLQRWLPPSPASDPPPATVPLLPEIPGLDQAAALERMLNNRALYLRLLRRFLDEHAAAPACLRELLAAGRADEAVDLLHRLKSLAATLGAVELQALSARLETLLQAGDDPGETSAALEAEHARLCAALRQALEEA